MEYVTKRYEKHLGTKQGCLSVCTVRRKFGRGTIIISVVDYHFNSNKHIQMFLLITQAFWVLLYKYGFVWCAIWVYLKSLNGSTACDFEHSHLGR